MSTRAVRPTSAPIQFVPEQAPGFADIAGAAPVAMNVVVDGVGAVHRRPGVTTTALAASSVTIDSGVAGLFVAGDGDVIAVGQTGLNAQRDIYRVTSGSALKIGAGAPPYGLRGLLRPTFAETEMLILIAGGDGIQKIEKVGFASGRLAGSPPSATHVIVQSNRLLANDVAVDRTKVRYSDVALGTFTYQGHELWSTGIGGAGYFTAEARPDNVQALAENTNEVFVFGTGTTQCFQPDPSLVFAPTSTIEVGLGAPYSVVKIDQKFLFMDQLRRFVVTDGRSFQVISQPVQRVLDEMATTSDCFGYRVTTGFIDTVVWTFPSDGRTFAFSKGQWSQWSGLSTSNGWAQFPVTAAATTPDTGKCLVGLSTGRIGELSQNANTDLGNPIVASVTTGYESRGTDSKKHCKAVRLALRRGLETTNPKALLSWRDRPGEWQQTVPVDIGASGDTEIVVTLRSLGTYRRRQWKFEFGGPETFVLASATEEFEVLDT